VAHISAALICYVLRWSSESGQKRAKVPPSDWIKVGLDWLLFSDLSIVQ
jgi:hypothetical protein